MPPIRQLIYVSRPVGKVSPAEERSLIQTSQRNNRRVDLTGLLACTGEHFLQVLEGMPADIEPVFQRIATDVRHTDLRVVSDRLVQTREYGKWSMAYVYSLGLDDAIRDLFSHADRSSQGVRALLDRLAPDSAMGTL